MSAVTNSAPVLLEQAGAVTDGDQYTQSSVASDVALLDGLPKVHQELAVTRMLDQSKQWLDRAMEATNPAREVSDFKAFVATVAEASKQKKLSEGIQLDAVEMVRRAERALGVAIRKGQDAGEIERHDEARSRAGKIARGSHQDGDDILMKAKPTEFAKQYELSHSNGGIYDMTDDVSEDAFEAGLAEAKDEGNLSRANVVRKVKEQKEASRIRAMDPERGDYLRSLTEKYPTLRMAFEAEAHERYETEGGLSGAVRSAGLAWRFTERQWQANVTTSTDILNRSSMAIEVALDAISERVDMSTITPEQATEALERLNSSALTRIIRKLKEISND